MYLILGTMDASGIIQEQGITRETVKRVVKTRITIGGLKYEHSVEKLLYTLRFDPMDEETLKGVALNVDRQYVSMSYKDPVLGYIHRKFIPEIRSTDLVMEDNNGVTYWSGLEIALEEQ